VANSPFLSARMGPNSVMLYSVIGSCLVVHQKSLACYRFRCKKMRGGMGRRQAGQQNTFDRKKISCNRLGCDASAKWGDIGGHCRSVVAHVRIQSFLSTKKNYMYISLSVNDMFCVCVCVCVSEMSMGPFCVTHQLTDPIQPNPTR